MKLNTRQVANFVADGFLRFDAVVPDDVNGQLLEELQLGWVESVPAGTPLAGAFSAGSALARFVAVPEVAGAIESLVGPGCLVDHHHVHRNATLADVRGRGSERPWASQPWHQDSTIDTRQAFDIQLMWYPQEVTAEMGGTRYLPGSHLRIVSEVAVARSQNILGQRHIVCPAGTVLVLHHGIWHGGGSNQSDQPRVMYKLRLNASVPQVRLWDDSDLTTADLAARPIFDPGVESADDDVRAILCRPQPWYEADTSRLEYINRIRLFRALLGDDTVDVDYWLTRLERQPGRRDESASRTNAS